MMTVIDLSKFYPNIVQEKNRFLAVLKRTKNTLITRFVLSSFL